MIDHKEFIKTWQEAEDAYEVAAKFGVSAAYVRARARFLRELGYELKRFDRRKQKA